MKKRKIKVYVNKDTIIDSIKAFYADQVLDADKEGQKEMLDSLRTMLSSNKDGIGDNISKAIKKVVTGVISEKDKNIGISPFIGYRIDLDFLEGAISKLQRRLLEIEGVEEVSKLKQTAESFPDLIGEEEFVELSKQYIGGNNDVVKNFVMQHGLILLWHQAQKHDFGVRGSEL